MSTLARGCVAEFIGTFALCFFGCASIALTQDSAGGQGSLLTVALAHALVLTVFVGACLYISGAQFNPAVSIALLALRMQDATKTIAFIATQLVAAAAGVGMMTFLLGESDATASAVSSAAHGATIGSLTLGGHTLAVFALEALMTFTLMFAILAGLVDARAPKLGGFYVGLTVATCIFAFGPLTGASMNPARTFGPAVYGHWQMHWVYWAAPIVGALLAGGVYKLVWTQGEPERA